jgi:lipopolysaccharide transport system ATP-binding protein
MEAVKQLCNKCILLENGEIKNIGKTETILQNYNKKDIIIKRNNNEIYFEKIDIENKNSNILIFKMNIRTISDFDNIKIAIGINSDYNQRITTLLSKSYNKEFNLKKGLNYVICEINNFSLKTGNYSIDIMIENDNFSYHEMGYAEFKIENSNFYPSGFIPQDEHGFIVVNQNWYLKNN